MSTLFVLIFLAAFPAFFLGMIAPQLYGRFSKNGVTRGKLAKIFVGTIIASFVGIALTAPSVEPKEQETIAKVEEESEGGVILEPREEENESISEDDDDSKEGESADALLRTTAKVVKVVDGDTVTVEIDGVRETIRIIGINTPETVDPRKPVECFGQEASARAHELLDNQTVALEAEETQGERDKYDRLLRYIFLSNGSDFGKQMISEGYAYEYTYATAYTYQQDYRASQLEAESAGRGLWGPNACGDAGENSGTSQESITEQAPVAVVNDPEPEPVQPTIANCSCSANIYNCGDFSTHAQAQAVYACCMSQVGYDVHRLDGDSDGQVCESLP